MNVYFVRSQTLCQVGPLEVFSVAYRNGDELVARSACLCFEKGIADLIAQMLNGVEKELPDWIISLQGPR